MKKKYSHIKHYAPTSETLTKLRHLQKIRKNNYAAILNELSVLKLFQLSNSDLLCSSLLTSSTKCLNLE